MSEQPELKVALINMPFPSLGMPSLALTQLATVIDERFGGRVATSTHYLSFDFARYLGDLRFYNHAVLGEGFMTGIGDWFFRQSAFPDTEDNSEAYFGRFYFSEETETKAVRAAYAEKRETLDAFIDQLIATYRLAEADIVGFTTLFSQTVASFAMAKRLKLANPDCITVIGGAACDGSMGQEFARLIPQIDYVFSGGGLTSFPRFAQHILDDDREACDRINGVFSKTNQAGREPGALPVALFGDDLDINENVKLDYQPFLDALERHYPDGNVRPVLLFETSRGCWWAEKSVCTFCGLNGVRRKQHWMTPDHALDQIESLARWVPRAQTFIAVDTIIPPDYIKEVFPRLKVPPEMKMFYELRATLSEEEVAVLNEANVVAFQPGIEALSTSTLKLMAKGTSAFQNVKFLKICNRYPVSLDWNLLIFSPGEQEVTYEKYMRDLPLLMHLAPPTGVYPIGFVRYSRYFDNPDDHGLTLQPQDFYGLTYPFDPETVARVAYHFVDRNADTDRMDYWLDALNQEVARWHARWTGEDGLPQARLELIGEEGAWSVYDSRSGSELQHPLRPVTREVLGYLAKPATASSLARRFSELQEDEVDREMTFLRERDLLFEENGRFMSLVVS